MRGRIHGGSSVVGPASGKAEARLTKVRVYRADTEAWEEIELKEPGRLRRFGAWLRRLLLTEVW